MTSFNCSLPFSGPMLIFSKKERTLEGSIALRVGADTCLCCSLLRNQTTVVDGGLGRPVRKESIDSPWCAAARGVRGGNHLRCIGLLRKWCLRGPLGSLASEKAKS